MSEIGVNKVILIGRTGADVDVKYTAGGKAVANFSLAINESFRKVTENKETASNGCEASRGESWQRSAGST